MGGANRLDARLESIESTLEKMAKIFEDSGDAHSPLKGHLDACVSFLEQRNAMVDDKLAMISNQLSDISMSILKLWEHDLRVPHGQCDAQLVPHSASCFEIGSETENFEELENLPEVESHVLFDSPVRNTDTSETRKQVAGCSCESTFSVSMGQGSSEKVGGAATATVPSATAQQGVVDGLPPGGHPLRQSVPLDSAHRLALVQQVERIKACLTPPYSFEKINVIGDINREQFVQELHQYGLSHHTQELGTLFRALDDALSESSGDSDIPSEEEVLECSD